MSKIVLGDLVRLRSGGPIMTVSSQEEDKVNCIWFDGNQMNQDSFERVILEKTSLGIYTNDVKKIKYLVEAKYDNGLGPKFETLGIIESESTSEARELAKQCGEAYYMTKKDVKKWITRIKPVGNQNAEF